MFENEIMRLFYGVFRFIGRMLPKVLKLLWGTGTLFLVLCWLLLGNMQRGMIFWIIGWIWAILGVTRLIARKITKDPKWGYIRLIVGQTTSRAEKKATDPNIAPQLKSSTPDGFVFGTKGSDYVRKPESTDGHILTIGGAGTGKSSCIAIPTLLSWNSRVFAIDIKGELSEKSKYKRPMMKIFNPSDPKAFGYDPFGILLESKNITQDITEIVLALIPLPTNTNDPFWIESAQDLLKGSLLYFYNQGYNFIEAIKLTQSTPVYTLVDEIKNSNDEKAKIFTNQFVGMDSKTLAGIFSQLSKNILLFATDEEIQDSLSKENTICPNDLEKGSDIYIVIPENMLEQWKNLLTLIVNQFLKHFERRAENNSVPILFLLDEFPRLGKIETILNGLATLRSKKITIALFVQSMAQLDLIYRKEARQVIADNCIYKAILSATDGETQEYLSKLVGTYDRTKSSTSANFEQHTGFGTGTGMSQTTEEKRIIKPEEFAQLQDILLLSPYGFNRVNKAPYYQDKYFQNLIS